VRVTGPASELEEVTGSLLLRYLPWGFKVGGRGPTYLLKDDRHTKLSRFESYLERNMSEVIRFVPNSELDRIQFIRQARAIYESVFPSAAAVSEQRSRASMSRTVVDASRDAAKP